MLEKKKQHSIGNQDDFIKIGGLVGNPQQRRALSKNDGNTHDQHNFDYNSLPSMT